MLGARIQRLRPGQLQVCAIPLSEQFTLNRLYQRGFRPLRITQKVGYRGGDFALGADGRLRRGGLRVYTGVQIVKTARVAEIPERVFSLNLLWNRLSEEGRLFGASYPGRWCDVGHPEGIRLAEEMLAADV